MSIFKRCPFYRDIKTNAIGKGIRHCDLCGQSICEGNIQFCEKPDDLRKQLEQKKNEILENRGEESQKKISSKYKVLVVDNEERLSKIFVAFLSKQGHQCVTASNGIEALSKIHQNKFDAVITDIVMPQMDGITLTKELLSLYPKLPIMVMTGYSKEYPVGEAITAGAVDFMGKPFSYDEFILRFNKMMRDHELSFEIESKQNGMFLHSYGESSERVN